MKKDDQVNEAPVGGPVSAMDEDNDRGAGIVDEKAERPGQTGALATRSRLIRDVRKAFSPRTITTLFILALPLVYFFPAIKGEIVLMMGDGLVYGFLMRVLIGDLLANGILPLWNPYNFGGMPLMAAVQPGALYPPNWIFAALPPNVAMNVVVMSTYYLALIGGYRYARAISAGRVAALVTAVTFAFGGFMISHLDQTNYSAAAAWAPWILLAIEKLYRKAAAAESDERYLSALWRWASLGAVCFALQIFAGGTQFTLYTVFVCAAYFIFSLFARGETGRLFRWRFTAACAAMAICGALLSAIQLLPTRELQQQSPRAAIDYDTFSTFSTPPRALLSLVFPFFFGDGKAPLYQIKPWDHWWIHKWVQGYVGICGLALILVAVFAAWRIEEKSRRRLTWFWLGVALIALGLALGDHLPFGLHRLLHHIPLYNLFRAPHRHMFEFTLASASLAGLGVTALERVEWAGAKRALIYAFITLASIVTATAIIYRFYADRLGAAFPPPAGRSFATPEAFTPLILFGLSLCALGFYARSRNRFIGAALVTLVMLDLASFGWGAGWRSTGWEIQGRLADPPMTQAIKTRETDLNSFRVMSYSIWPYGGNFEALNHANISAARHLQSATGYDPIRLPRPAAMAGDIDIFGGVRDQSVFGLAHRGFDLMNVKYLLRERSAPLGEPGERVITIDGVRFEIIPTEHKLAPGARVEVEADGMAATELALVTTLTDSGGVPDQTPVARISLHAKDGSLIERELLAGRDTSEWAYDRPDVRASIKHTRAKVAESWSAEGFEAHRYLARLTFDRAEIDYVEIANIRPETRLVVSRATLTDGTTGGALSLDRLRLPSERWRSLGGSGAVELFENLRPMPRAWFVNRVVALPGDQALLAIQTGKLGDGSDFDPAQVALLDAENAGASAVQTPQAGAGAGAEVKVTRYEPTSIELITRNPQPGFLMLSEIYYGGWEALIDGARTPIHRADYTLRGLAVPSGEHRIEFVFRAPSALNGAVFSSLGLFLLLAGALITRRAQASEKGFGLVIPSWASGIRQPFSPAGAESRERRFSIALPPRLSRALDAAGEWLSIPRVADRITIIFLVLLPPLFFWRETLGWYTLGAGDLVNQVFPAFALAIAQIAGGQAPLWNPNIYSGMPLFADAQIGLLDPLNWVYFISTTARAITVSQEMTFAIALLAAYAYSRALGFKRRASVVTAVIYSLSGFAVARALYPALPHVFALTPLLFCFIERLSRRNSRSGEWRDVIGGALVVAWQIFAAHPQPLAYSALLAACYALFRAWSGGQGDRETGRQGDRETGVQGDKESLNLPLSPSPLVSLSPTPHSPLPIRLRFLAQCLSMFVIGAALAAVQLIPTWELVGQSMRDRLEYETFAENSLHPISLLVTLFPFFHGGGQESGIYHMPYWGSYWHHNEAQLYLGALALALALAGAVQSWRMRFRIGMFWGVAAIVACFFSFGMWLGPLAKVIYYLPVFGNFRSSNRLWMVVALAAAVLAGFTVDRLLRAEESPENQKDSLSTARNMRSMAALLFLLCAGVGAFALAGAGVSEQIVRALTGWDFLPAGFLRQAGAEFYLPIICAAGALIVIALCASGNRSRYWFGLLLVALLIDFNLYATSAPIRFGVKFENMMGKLLPAELAAKQSERDPLRYHFWLPPGPSSFEPFWFFGHEMATGRDPLIGARYREFTGMNEGSYSKRATTLDARDRTLDLLNVRYLIALPQTVTETPEAVDTPPAPQAEDRAGGDVKSVEYDGIAFAGDEIRTDLPSGQSAVFSGKSVADTLAMVSTLSNAAAVADDEEVAEITVRCGGQSSRLSLRAGRDTAEWAYDRADVRAMIKHSRARVATNSPESSEAGDFLGHAYLARLRLPDEASRCDSPVSVLVTNRASGQVTLSLRRLALYDSASRRALPMRKINQPGLSDTARWREAPNSRPLPDGPVLRVFENQRAMPRVWTVNRVEARKPDEQLRLIRGEMADARGSAFDPRAVALVDQETTARLDNRLLARDVNPAPGAARILSRNSKATLIEAEVSQPSLLVASEIAFPGWRVKVDGRAAEWHRVNYLLRGVELSPGKHQVLFFYRPRSVIIGATLSGLTAICLALAWLWRQRKSRKPALSPGPAA